MREGSEGEGKESFLSPLPRSPRASRARPMSNKLIMKAFVGEELSNKDETSGHKIALKLAQ